jgi:hypothetical protein
MTKRERISQFVADLVGGDINPAQMEVGQHPFYHAYFRCWNEQRYYEAHDVLEQLWLNTDSVDDNFFKGLIQAAGAFVHLQKNFEQPSHPKHSQRLRPAVRLLELAQKKLSSFAPRHHGLDVTAFCKVLRAHADQIITSDYKMNPWSPATAPKLRLTARQNLPVPPDESDPGPGRAKLC